jgi:hypothetical protein
MALATPKSESVREDGTPDGWSPPAAFLRDIGPAGQTQLVVSVPTAWLGRVHRDLVAALSPPLGVLYRQVVDRRDPQPEGSPPRDFVGLELSHDAVRSALTQFEDLLYHDARCELWVRGAMNDQIILDADGLIYLVPDDPAFEDVLRGAGLSDDLEQTIRDRDYAKHWFHAPNDALEDAFLRTLKLTEVPSFKAR